MRHRAPLLWVLLPFSFGIAAARLLPNDTPPLAWACAAALLAVVAVVCTVQRVALALLVASAAFAGFGRCLDARQRAPDLDGLPARALSGRMAIERLFGRPKAGRINGIGRIHFSNTTREWARQRIYFSLKAPRGTAPEPGALVAFHAVAEPIPDASPPDSFEGYLVSSGVNLHATRGRIDAVLSPPPRLERLRCALVSRCRAWLSEGIAHRPDLVAVHHGLLLGELTGLSPDQKALYSETGTLHLFSVSGLHIGVVALALHTALGWMQPNRRAWVLVPLLGVYVWLTGSSAAAMRAFWMVATLELGRATGRTPNALSALCVAALIGLAADPPQLFSAGFQFSYGIVASLILLGQPLDAVLQERCQPFEHVPEMLRNPLHRASRWLVHHLCTTLSLGVASAFVGELCTLRYFHLLTPGALLANLILIPLSSLAIIAGMLSMAAGACGIAPLSSCFNHAAALLIQLIVWLLEPWHSVEGTFLRAEFRHPVVGGVALAGALLLILFSYRAGWPRRRGYRWVPWVAVSAALVFGVKVS